MKTLGSGLVGDPAFGGGSRWRLWMRERAGGGIRHSDLGG